MRLFLAILLLMIFMASCAQDTSCPAYGRTQANVQPTNRV